MDDGEVELSDPVFLSKSSWSNSNARGSASVDSIVDEFFKHTRTCTHTHTCNPAGPDSAHTHTCYHTHTQVFSSGEDTKAHSGNPSLKPRKPLGNREAVRRYREKKKAHTAYLEEEVKKLRVFNQQLIRKLQGRAVLEAEILRLRAFLLDLRGKIDIELGSFPFLKHCSSNPTFGFREDDCGMRSAGSVEAIGLQCQAVLPCLKPRENQPMPAKAVLSGQGNCQPTIVDCCVAGSGEDGSDNPVEAAETLVSTKNHGQ